MEALQKINNDRTEFSGVVFKNLEMTDAVLSNKEFCECQFKQCNFSNSDFTNCQFDDCEFVDCNLSLIKITGSKFRTVDFKKCKVIGVNWCSANWSSIQISCPIGFDECILNDSIFYGLYLAEVKMEACQLHDIDFSEANCEDASFIQSDFLNSRFNQTNLTRADFIDAVNYTVNVFDNQISKAKFSLPEAACLLDSLDIEVVE